MGKKILLFVLLVFFFIPTTSFAALYLKESSGTTIKLGPFLDSADGNTLESALTISQSDVYLSKNGGTFQQKNEATGCTYDTLGFYGCAIDSTDTDFPGRLQIAIHEAGALHVFTDFVVLNSEVYDSFFSTDNLQVDIAQVGGDNITDNNDGRLEVNVEEIADSAVSVSSAQIGVNVVNYGGDAVSDTVAGIPDVNVTYWEDSAITDADSDPDVDVESIGAGLITATVMATNCITNDEIATTAATEIIDNFETQSQADPTGFHINVLEIGGTSQTANDNGADINAILVDTGTTLQGEVDGIQADTEDIQTQVGTAGAGLTNLGGMSTTMKGQVNAECDTAISDAGLTSAAIVDAVWDEATSGHVVAGTTGKAITDAQSAGDPWATAIPGSYTAGEAGYVVGNQIKGATVGPGSTEGILTITVAGSPVDNAKVWITSDEAGATVVGGALYTDTSGQVTFMIDIGVTYYVWREHAGYTFSNPQTWIPN